MTRSRERPAQRTPRITRLIVIGLLLASFLILSGCSTSEPPAALSPAAAEGRDIAVARGCTSCHGGDFDGGVAPSLVGVFGTEVPLVEGGMVIADRAYLVESIADPNAKRRLGSVLQMPMVTLTDQEIERIVDYLVELGTTS
jgi:cytochrome c oxidase subunit 2